MPDSANPQGKNRKIVQSNQMTEASYYLSRDQKRILYLCMSKMPLDLDEGDVIPHNGKFQISVAEYAEVHGLPSSAASQDIRVALEKFKGQEVMIYRPEFDLGDEKGYDAYPWLAKRGYRPCVGVYHIHINPELLPFMAGLRKRFTTYHMIEVNNITNPLVMRLYESLCQYRGAGSEGYAVLDIDWIRKRYMLPESYSRIQDFRKRFLDVAIKEINEKTPLRVTVEERKKGRAITTLVFRFVDVDRRRAETGIGETVQHEKGGQTDLAESSSEVSEQK